MSYLTIIEASDVRTVEDLMEYVRSRYGVVVTVKQKVAFRVHLKQFLEDNPHLGDLEQAIPVLVKAADWGKQTKRKCTTLHGLFYLTSFAYAAGALPELDPDYLQHAELEQGIFDALSVEQDETWRNRLICSEGEARVRALNEWRDQHLAVA